MFFSIFLALFKIAFNGAKHSSSFLSSANSNQRGQTTTEYVILLAAVVAIAVTIFGQIKTQFSANPDLCDNPTGINVVCAISNSLGYRPQDGVDQNSFRSFRVL